MSKSKKGILLYRASRDGFNENDFNSRCYGKTDTITIIRNNLNYVFGVYASAPWNISGGYINDPNSFLFSLRRNGKSYNDRFTKNQTSNVASLGGIQFGFQLVPQSINIHNPLNIITANQPSYGSSFGGGQTLFSFAPPNIKIVCQSNILTERYINFVHLYNVPCSPGVNAKDFFTGNYNQSITIEIEVYQIIVEHI